MRRRALIVLVLLAAGAYLLCPKAPKEPTAHAAERNSPAPEHLAVADWREAERGILENHVQLTFPDRFIKAGESYFSPDDRQIIFQAVEVPAEGQKPEAFYQMYVADVVYDASGRIAGLTNYKRLSPPGSSNTCGWFHPTRPGVVIFGSTLGVPADAGASGYQRGTSRYVWEFPREMTIVECEVASADGTAATLKPLLENREAYLAECVISPNGRYLVYCRRVESEGQRGGDLLIRDLTTGRDVVIAGHAGYDGGPFFSPDGTRLCYRSDRRGDNLLQIFVAELAFNASGEITGLAREFQLTDNPYVNWAPFWTPDGRFLVYAGSEMGHRNYEVFIIDADAGDPGTNGRPAKYGTRNRRITHAEGFDGLPAFNRDGSVMIWTSQRDESKSSQLWAASFVFDTHAAPLTEPEPAQARPAPMPYVADPETGLMYVYDPATHAIIAYDPRTHAKREVTDEAEKKRATELIRGKK